MSLITLKKRREFLRLRGGARWANAAFILETKPRTETRPKDPINGSSQEGGQEGGQKGGQKAGKNAARSGTAAQTSLHGRTARRTSGSRMIASDETLDPPRFGFTVTKRLGNAVTRNLIRRRLKEAIRTLAAHHAKPGFDHVIIAKSGILACGYEQLTRDLKTALERVHQPRPHRPKIGQRKS